VLFIFDIKVIQQSKTKQNKEIKILYFINLIFAMWNLLVALSLQLEKITKFKGTRVKLIKSSQNVFYFCFRFISIFVPVLFFIFKDITIFCFLFGLLVRICEDMSSGSLLLSTNTVAVAIFIACLYAFLCEDLSLIFFLFFVYFIIFPSIIFTELLSSDYFIYLCTLVPVTYREVTILPTIQEIPETPNPLDIDNIFGLQ